jgi:DNA-binding MarR family transcriptional regulator
VLEALAERDWLSQLDLARTLGINRTVMVWVLDRMEESGFVERNRNPENRRSYVLSLTDAGRLGLGEMREKIGQRNMALTATLTSAERDRLIELLKALVPDRVRPAPDNVEALVSEAFHRYRQIGDELVADTGLRMRHFAPLNALNALAPCAQQQLAQYLAITEPAAAEVVDFLVRAGMVKRGRDTRDRRRYALELTDKGRGALVVVLKAVDALQADTVSLIGVDGDAELRDLLYRLLGSEESIQQAG